MGDLLRNFATHLDPASAWSLSMVSKVCSTCLRETVAPLCVAAYTSPTVTLAAHLLLDCTATTAWVGSAPVEPRAGHLWRTLGKAVALLSGKTTRPIPCAPLRTVLQPRVISTTS